MNTVCYNIYNQIHKASIMIRKVFSSTLKMTNGPLYLMAKQKPGKQEVKEVEIPPQPTSQQLIHTYFQPYQNTLSPSQLQTLQNSFDDICEEDKKMLNDITNQIVQLQTPAFFEFVRRSGLGTSQCFFTSTEELTQEEIIQNIEVLQKQ